MSLCWYFDTPTAKVQMRGRPKDERGVSSARPRSASSPGPPGGPVVGPGTGHPDTTSAKTMRMERTTAIAASRGLAMIGAGADVSRTAEGSPPDGRCTLVVSQARSPGILAEIAFTAKASVGRGPAIVPSAASLQSLILVVARWLGPRQANVLVVIVVLEAARGGRGPDHSRRYRREPSLRSAPTAHAAAPLLDRRGVAHDDRYAASMGPAVRSRATSAAAPSRLPVNNEPPAASSQKSPNSVMTFAG
jgi:hypothetical protein